MRWGWALDRAIEGFFYASFAGGCMPITNKARRMLTRPSRFNCKASTVARPVGVKPITRVKSALHRKCSDQLCSLGWYRGTTAPSTGSGAWVLLYLWPLHPGQANARLSNVVSPLRLTGRMCSTENDWVAKSARLLQYSQQLFARATMVCCSRAVTVLLGISRLPDAQFDHQGRDRNVAQLR